MIDSQFYTIGPALTVAALANRLGIEISDTEAGNESIKIPSALNTSLPGSVTFFSDKKRKDQLATANATVCLTTEKLLPLISETDMVALITDNPRAVFARLTNEMVTEGVAETQPNQIDKTAVIHPSVVIGRGVTIGANTRIGANCVIDDGVTIGERCILQPLVRLSFTKLGDRCHIKSGTILGGTGFGTAEDENGIFNVPHIGRVIIHDDVYIGSNTCVDRGQLGDTVICKDVKIDNLVQIGHNVFIGEGTLIAGHAGISGSCVIGKKCIFAGKASLADHINVGDGAILAAFAGVMSDVPAGEMYSGIPAMPVRVHMRNVATLKKLTKRK